MSSLRNLFHIRRWRRILSGVFYLNKTHAPRNVLVSFIVGCFRNEHLAKKYSREIQTFEEKKSKLKLSSDWFTRNAPFWLSLFDAYCFPEKRQIKALEIGSWEGLSSYFILHALPNATLTCVDPWVASGELGSGYFATREMVNHAEGHFDSNLAPFAERLVKYKGNSLSFFNDHTVRDEYDFIYIDGSHYCDDVVIDAIKCFEMLKVGGVMIFDDYFWRYYSSVTDNPAAAINAFLRLKQGHYKIARTYYQIAIEKTRDRDATNISEAS